MPLNSENKVLERLIFKKKIIIISRITIFCLLFNLVSFPRDLTENQLTFLYHTFCEALDAGKDVLVVVCDTSKKCYLVWHTGLSYEPRHEICNNVVCATSKASDQPAHTRSLIRGFASHLNIL